MPQHALRRRDAHRSTQTFAQTLSRSSLCTVSGVVRWTDLSNGPTPAVRNDKGDGNKNVTAILYTRLLKRCHLKCANHKR